jgi:hypothetical protein
MWKPEEELKYEFERTFVLKGAASSKPRIVIRSVVGRKVPVITVTVLSEWKRTKRIVSIERYFIPEMWERNVQASVDELLTKGYEEVTEWTH